MRVDALGQVLHGDAVLDRADIDAEIAADAFGVDHLEMAAAVLRRGDRLMRGVLADDVAAAAFDAEVLVDARLGDVVEVEILPVGDDWARRGRRDRRASSASRRDSGQAGDHLLDDPEAIGHRRRADLNVAAPSAMNSAASRQVVMPPMPEIG